MRSLPFKAAPLLLFALVSTTGCAAAFRNGKPNVKFESDPAGADVWVNNRTPNKTPYEAAVERSGTTAVLMTKEGYADHRGVVKKSLNPAWVAFDIIDCVFPIALCIPLLVDAISGAWNDVPEVYTAHMEKGTSSASAKPADSGGDKPAPASTAPPAPIANMSESERKATARAAFLEGVELQDANKCAEALPRFEAAQRLFDAPTHQLHIAQCQAATGKLVEAQETYETLSHASLAASAPEAFKQAQEQAKKDLPGLHARVPTLRIGISPAPSSLSGLVITVNGATVSNDLIGLARPMNPGAYKITATAKGYGTVSNETKLEEGAPKSVDLKLVK